MNALSRRTFLVRGSCAVAGLAGASSVAAATPRTSDDSPDETLAAGAAGQHALLFDSTLCVGCRACELACNRKNDLGRTADQVFRGRGLRMPVRWARTSSPT